MKAGLQDREPIRIFVGKSQRITAVVSSHGGSVLGRDPVKVDGVQSGEDERGDAEQPVLTVVEISIIKREVDAVVCRLVCRPASLSMRSCIGAPSLSCLVLQLPTAERDQRAVAVGVGAVAARPIHIKQSKSLSMAICRGFVKATPC